MNTWKNIYFFKDQKSLKRMSNDNFASYLELMESQRWSRFGSWMGMLGLAVRVSSVRRVSGTERAEGPVPLSLGNTQEKLSLRESAAG